MGLSDLPEAELGAAADPAPQPSQAVAEGFTPLRVLALLGAVAVTAAIFVFRHELTRFAAYGYLGIFVINLVGNATVLLPVPGLLATAAGGAAFPWIGVGLVSGVAQSLGELTGYMAGYGGGAVIENRAYYARVRGWMKKRGLVTIVVLAAIPNPVFDVAGICAGALRMPVWQFFLACWLGKTLKSLAVALFGFLSAQWLAPLLQRLGG